MLSEKEVIELGERAMGHLSLMEKYSVYAQQCPDQQVRDILTRHQQIFQNHYQMLVGLMQNAQTMTGTVASQAMTGITTPQAFMGATTTQTQWRPS
ncbi:MAG: hypothetical protein ACOY46_00525 [Bacillota bacterium]